MSKVFIEESTLTAIGDSIRAKTGKTDMIPPLQMPIEIENVYEAGYQEAYNAMKLAVDMSDVTYRFNEKVTSYPGNWYNMNLNFTDANGVAYKQITTFTSSSKINIRYTTVSGSYIEAYNAANSPMWADEAYRTIHITDGAMTGDIKTCAWLSENGQFNPTD